MKKTYGDNQLLKKYINFKNFTDIEIGIKKLLTGIRILNIRKFQILKNFSINFMKQSVFYQAPGLDSLGDEKSLKKSNQF